MSKAEGILVLLAWKAGVSVYDIAKATGISAAVVEQHIRESLRNGKK